MSRDRPESKKKNFIVEIYTLVHGFKKPTRESANACLDLIKDFKIIKRGDSEATKYLSSDIVWSTGEKGLDLVLTM